MLGVDQELDWTLVRNEGLWITPPSDKPCDNAYVFKIQRKRPF
jgi:hypothetical protein